MIPDWMEAEWSVEPQPEGVSRISRVDNGECLAWGVCDAEANHIVWLHNEWLKKREAEWLEKKEARRKARLSHEADRTA